MGARPCETPYGKKLLRCPAILLLQQSMGLLRYRMQYISFRRAIVAESALSRLPGE